MTPQILQQLVSTFVDDQVGLDLADGYVHKDGNEIVVIMNKRNRQENFPAKPKSNPNAAAESKEEWRYGAQELVELLAPNFGEWEIYSVNQNGFTLFKQGYLI